MLHFRQKTPPPPGAPKPRSLFATLFVPDVGRGFRPLQETVQMFVSLVAMLFAMNGLFPRDHPALVHPGSAKLSLEQIIRTAWKRLSFTEKGMPQVMFFFGAIGCMLIPIILAVIAFFSLFVARAHAATNFFVPPGGTGAGSTDLAIQFINYLFLADPLNSAVLTSPAGQNTVLSSTVIQCGIYVALGFYSDAILIIAAMILFYHLAWMTVETAHHGVVMGQRGNQVWAPIRLVFAVGILVPTGGGGATGCGAGTGLSSGQILAIAIAQWGSGMASNAWQAFVNQLTKETFSYVPPPVSAVRKVVTDMVSSYACVYAFNWYVDPAYPTAAGLSNAQAMAYGNIGVTNPGLVASEEIEDPQQTISGSAAPASAATPPWVITLATQATEYTFTNKTIQDEQLCGSYIVPAAPTGTDSSFVNNSTFGSTIVDNIYKAHLTDFQNFMPNFQDGGSTAVSWFISSHPNFGKNPSPPTGNEDLFSDKGLIEKYQVAILNDVQAATTGTDNAIQADAAAFTNGGWITAGAWFNRIARIQDDVFNAGTDGLPITTPPNVAGTAALNRYYEKQDTVQNPGDAAQVISIYKSVQADLISMESTLAKYSNSVVTPPAGNLSLQQQMEISARELNESESNPCLGGKLPHPSDCVFWLIDHTAAMFGVWHASPTQTTTQENLLGVQFTGANPLAEVAAFGQANVNAAYTLFDFALVASAVGGAATGFAGGGQYQSSNVQGQIDATANYIGGFVGGIGTLLMTAGFIFFTIGFTMGFYVPLIPFISFFFGTLTWFVAMLEAVIAVPLIALAHLNPEGDGLPGNTGKQAYFFLFQVFLRPTLMIFGLLSGLIIFYMGVTLLNALFAVAVAGTGGLNHGHFTAARLIYTMIYVILVVTTANNSFQLITRLPDTAMNWLGANGLPGANMGDATRIEEGLSAVQAYLGQQYLPAAGQAASSAGQGIGFGARMAGGLLSGKTGGGITTSTNTKKPS